MGDFSIALSGLNAAQAALDVIGNNVANAATEGYHRQRIDLVPASVGNSGVQSFGTGVDVAGVTRLIDDLLEREMLRQEAVRAQTEQELSTLSSLETTFGEFGEQGGLNYALDSFFDSLRSLAAHPLENVWRSEVINSANVLTDEFRRLGSSLTSLENQIAIEADNTGASINLLTRAIAELNGKIQVAEIGHGQANNLRDHRDSLILQLSQLVSIQTQAREYGVVDVDIAGLPAVTGAMSLDIRVRLEGDQSLSVSEANTEGRRLLIEGGRLGGLLSLKNVLLQEVRNDLDTLARTIVNQVNTSHVQGVGVSGSFAELTGWAMNSTDLTGVEPPIRDGTFYLRMTDAAGNVERHAVAVDVSGTPPDTLASVAAQIDAIDGLSAAVVSSRLHIVADLGTTFDFTPGLLPEPETMNLTAVSPPEVSIAGLYNDKANQTFTFTAVGTGPVGNGDLRLDVTDESGVVVSTVNVGVGYAAGDAIELANGIKISLSRGDLNDGDSFVVQALANTDSSGLLAAVGMNTFFSGASASEMEVCASVAGAPGRVATAFTGALTDNAAVLRLADIRDEAIEGLGGMTPGEYYQRTTTNLGQQISLKQSRQENLDAMIQNLHKQRSDVSAVNVNEEAAQLMIFEKMFQASAKYLSSVQTALTTLMELL